MDAPYCSNVGKMQQGCPDATTNYQIVQMCEVSLTQGDWLYWIYIIMNDIGIIITGSMIKILFTAEHFLNKIKGENIFL